MQYPTNNIKHMSKTKQLVFISVLVAQAIVLNYFEKFIPLQMVLPIPGFKLGLANIVTLTSIYFLSFSQALSVVLLRTAMSAVLYGSISGFMYSISGGLLSFIVMYLLVKIMRDKISTIGVSVIGAIFHNIGQLTIAALIIHNKGVFGYLPFLMFTAVGTGLVVGLTVKFLMKYLVKIM